MRHRHVYWLVSALLSLLLLTGCSSQPFRESVADEPWPELADQAEDCHDISGIYSAMPRLHGKAKTLDTPLLAYTLLPASPRLGGADRVSLTVADTSLKVTASAGTLPLLTHTYTSDEGSFSCTAGTLAFHPGMKPGAAAASATPGIDWETLHLRRTQDGSLLLQKADGLASLAFMLFPIYLTTDNWYLFKPLEEQR